jgi:hypothetical protein
MKSLELFLSLLATIPDPRARVSWHCDQLRRVACGFEQIVWHPLIDE